MILFNELEKIYKEAIAEEGDDRLVVERQQMTELLLDAHVRSLFEVDAFWEGVHAREPRPRRTAEASGASCHIYSP